MDQTLSGTGEEFDFIAIGDTVIDDFIRINKASMIRTENPEGMVDDELCFPSGAKIPYEFHAILAGVGNAANAAVSASRLGLKAALIADVGDEERGQDVLNELKKNNVDTTYVKVNAGKITNFHYVLWHGAERTILIKHEEYAYKMPDVGSPKWLYFSSVGDNSLPYHEEIAEYLKSHPLTKLAFQPGTFQIKLGTEALKDLYARTEIFFCNVEEARLVLKNNEPNPAKLGKMMSTLGPKISVITDGPKGAYAYDGNSGKTFFMPPYPDPKPPYERTGAGDACASTITIALALGLPFTTALAWGPINSMSVVQYVGAQEGLLSRPALEKFLAARPENYVATEVNID